MDGLDSDESANLGLGEADMAIERSCPKVLDVASDRRRRLCGIDDDIVGGREL